MKKYLYSFVLLLSATFTSCSDWLEMYPENAQVSDSYWKSQSDVECVVNSGYYYLREIVINQLIPLGELRGGAIYTNKSSDKLQTFQVKPTDQNICNWGSLYQIIGISNVILTNAPKAQAQDKTYKKEEMNSHFTEAYFLRALSYFYLVRNWREVPLVLDAFEDDSHEYKLPQSSEAEVVAQIKADILAAIQTGAAKEYYGTTWETKGRATKWALYALMADVCLWSEDYETALKYCDGILESTSARAPSFMYTATHNSWFSMFNPGNSNESIFEIQWNYQEQQMNSLPTLFNTTGKKGTYIISPTLLQSFKDEYEYTLLNEKEAVRTMYGGFFVDGNAAGYDGATQGFVWKYVGSQNLSDPRTNSYYDPNFIIYRVAEVMLMKAEALILRESANKAEDYQKAIDLLNTIRVRSNLEPYVYSEDYSEEYMLDLVFYERSVELVGEGKFWYDALRFGRRADNEYKQTFLVGKVMDYNSQAGQSWLSTVLNDDDALFLPVWEKELETNDMLIQNPYYN